VLALTEPPPENTEKVYGGVPPDALRVMPALIATDALDGVTASGPAATTCTVASLVLPSASVTRSISVPTAPGEYVPAVALTEPEPACIENR
jgi:hypothetical protein